MRQKQLSNLFKSKDLPSLKICGIDCSTTVLGYSILQGDTLELYGHHEFSSELSLYERVKEFRSIMFSLLKGCDYFILEDRLKAFSGRTTAQTLMSLSYMNAGVEIALKDNFGIDCVLNIHPSTARKIAWGSARSNDKSEDTKQWIIRNVIQHYGMEFPVKERSKQKVKPYKDYVGDICDSITLSRVPINCVK